MAAVCGYDANGNMTTRNGSTFSYASYNLPTSIAPGADSSTLAYGRLKTAQAAC